MLSPSLCLLAILSAAQLLLIFATPLIPATSKCAAAYGTNKSPHTSGNGIIESVFNFTPVANASLVVINVGFGTTATHAVFDYDRKQMTPSCHFNVCDPPGLSQAHYSGILAHFMILDQCVMYKRQEYRCDTSQWYVKLKTLLEAVVKSGIKNLGDTPIPMYFRELIDLVPSLQVQQSLRDPMTWVLKRISEHDRADLMCDIRLPQVSNSSSNPFDILHCMNGSKYLNERIISMGEYIGIHHSVARKYDLSRNIPQPTLQLINEVAGFFADFNQRVVNTLALLNSSEQHVPICVWDGDLHTR